MVRAIGVDPGTRSFSIFGIEGDRIILDVDVPSTLVAEKPQEIARIMMEAKADAIAGPSGYGLPVKKVSEVDEKDLFLSILLRRGDESLPVLRGVVDLIRIAKEYRLPMYLIPSVILLPTVPRYRKYNRIDMGTADKLAVAVLGVYDQARRLNIPYDWVSFILVEMGGAYTSVVGVEGGLIVDGIGGSQGPLGLMSHGRMDGEVAYILGEFPKRALFQGGAAHIAGDPDMTIEDIVSRKEIDPRAKEAYTLLLEETEKFVLAMTASVRRPREILLSGRLTNCRELVEDLRERLKRIAPVRVLEGFRAKAKTPAQGAALIADGLAGGPRRDLITHMRIAEARGTVLDYVLVEEWRRRVEEASGLRW